MRHNNGKACTFSLYYMRKKGIEFKALEKNLSLIEEVLLATKELWRHRSHALLSEAKPLKSSCND